jgi:phosphoribosyl 1,2-cyclic phosphodiesterase
LFLGSGSSSGTPHIYHLMQEPPSPFEDEASRERYTTSIAAAAGNPADNKNYRCNPSILIRYRGDSKQGEKNILVDVGKTFRESAVRWFLRHSVSSVDGVLLTHGHADAIFGLDDIRGVRDRVITTPLDVYLSEDCMKVVRKTLFYLVKEEIEDQVQVQVRSVSNLKWNVVAAGKSLNLLGLDILPVNVMHGEDMTSFAFIFGKRDRVCYISDVSRIIPETMEIIKEKPVDILVIDALFKDRHYFSHYSLPQAIETIRIIRPKKAYLIGMSSELEHEKTNAELKELLKEGLDVELSYDGLSVDVEL